ncbi:MAG: prepilin-type N-terminal cleavage/methylation domain-containing protein [Patescibacteria group bacterium]
MQKKLRTTEQGFTLIELLIVIVIIGILAVALLAAVDPLEQIRRGRDTETLKAARDFMSAAERYYAYNEEYPWDDTVGSAPQWEKLDSTNWSDYGGLLQDTGELRERFHETSPISEEKLILSEEDATGNEDALHVCFEPESSQMGNQACCDDTLACGDAGSADYFCVPDCSQ